MESPPTQPARDHCPFGMCRMSDDIADDLTAE